MKIFRKGSIIKDILNVILAILFLILTGGGTKGCS